ncbi:MAG: DUF4149 domain-containing protein [Campylobacterota bacterium]|nr:DUF4149 domain-containing protein [Campylobacterota bacterium]
MKRQNIYIELGYLLLLGATFGAVLILGIVVASTIFNTQTLVIPLELSRYDQGLIMGEVFRRFSYFTYFMAIVVTMYEVVEYRNLRRDSVAMLSAIVVIFTLLLFSAVYVPKILELQSLGVAATLSEDFINIHKASEVDFKILAVSILILFIRRVTLLRTIKA